MSEDQKTGDELLNEAGDRIASLDNDGEEHQDQHASDHDDDYTDDLSGAADELSDEDNAEMQRAIRDGWKPESEYTGPPGQWRDYKEFNAVGDRIAGNLNSKIDNLTEANTKQAEMIKKLIAAQGKITKQAHEQAARELQERRTDAIRAGDPEAVAEIDEELDSLKGTAQAIDTDLEELEKEDEPVDVLPETTQWIERNKSWYNEQNPGLVQYARNVELAEIAVDPNAPVSVVLDRVAMQVKKRFPQHFQNKRRNSRTVESGTRSAREGSANFSAYPEEVRKMAEDFERSGVMSKEEYLKALKGAN